MFQGSQSGAPRMPKEALKPFFAPNRTRSSNLNPSRWPHQGAAARPRRRARRAARRRLGRGARDAAHGPRRGLCRRPHRLRPVRDPHPFLKYTPVSCESLIGFFFIVRKLYAEQRTSPMSRSMHACLLACSSPAGMLASRVRSAVRVRVVTWNLLSRRDSHACAQSVSLAVERCRDRLEMLLFPG